MPAALKAHKRVDYAYAPGTCSLWLKSKCLSREEFVVIGRTDPAVSRTSALCSSATTRMTAGCIM
jgi:hypothetical protein